MVPADMPVDISNKSPMVQVRFVDVVVRLPSPHPVVILEEIGEIQRRLHIPVGSAEGMAIASAAQRMITPKPLTHRFLIDVLDAFNLTAEVLRITRAEGRSYFAELVFSGPQGTRTVPCRPSDGLATVLWISPPVPITVSDDVFGQATDITTSTE